MTLTELAIKKMTQLGATEAEAYVRKTTATRVNFAEKIENFKTAEATGIALRAALGKRIAMYSTSILDESEVSNAATKVVKIAKATLEDPSWKHMNGRFGNAHAEGHFDLAIENLETQQIVKRLNSATASMKNFDERVKPSLSSLSATVSNVTIENCCGEISERKETTILVSLNAKAEENAMTSTAREFQAARLLKQVDFERLAETAADKAVKCLRAKPLSSRKTVVVIRNQAFANMLGLMLGESVNAESVQNGRSPLIGKLGTEIASDKITVVDDGLLRFGWNTRPFDDEGYATQKTVVVEDGLLRNYLYDTYTSLKDNVESTGNCSRRDYWSRPQPSPSNFILQPGGARLEELIRDVQNGIFIEETIGDWLSDPVSGNLAATVSQGYLIEKGELTQPIKGMVLSANFHELMKDQIDLIGNDLKNNVQNYSPSIRIRELTVAGQN